jgi:hypothetical protein
MVASLHSIRILSRRERDEEKDDFLEIIQWKKETYVTWEY